MIKNLVLIFLIPMFVCGCDHSQTPAFPDAQGGGMFASGGRGGEVLFVDNLNDKGNGSFRKAIEADGPRTIIFRVSGNIELQKTIHIKHGDLTIAGQTAPGDGICLKNYGLRLDADNLIIRYLRVRPGDLAPKEQDAISGSNHKNIIIDHCSFSWSNDEVASLYDNSNFSMQWCIISESLYNSTHHKGKHGYGGIWGGLNASFHHNLLCDHTSRNPRLCGSRFAGVAENEKTDLSNNVLYNWGYNSIYGGEEGSYNIVNNYYKPGPATAKKSKQRILELTQTFYNQKINPDTLGAGWFYISGNVIKDNLQISMNNWDGGIQKKGLSEEIMLKSKLSEPISVTKINTTDALTAYEQVLETAGASLRRDAVDARIIEETKTGIETFGSSFEGGGNGIIDSQNDVGGWPILKSKSPEKDSDNDGMPDSWEKQNKLDPLNPNDNSLKSIDKEYTNIEIYINSLVDHLIPN